MNLGRTILLKDRMMGGSLGGGSFSVQDTKSEIINHHLLIDVSTTHTILLHPKPNHLDIRRIYPKTNSSPLKMNSWETILSFSSWVSAKVSGTKSQYSSEVIHIMSNIEFQQNQRHQKIQPIGFSLLPLTSLTLFFFSQPNFSPCFFWFPTRALPSNEEHGTDGQTSKSWFSRGNSHCWRWRLLRICLKICVIFVNI